MKPAEKRKILVDIIEDHVSRGYDISIFVGKPLHHFNWDYLLEIHKVIKKEI